MLVSIPLIAVTVLLTLALLYQMDRRAELAAMRRDLGERGEARRRGSDKAQLQHPHVDLSRCFGCGACVRACPEEGVLGLIHGQAAVLHGARCVGHGLCAQACPAEAITVSLGDLKDRKDIPALTERFEAVGVPGLFLAGEVTGHALIRTAVAHGKAIADEAARRIAATHRRAQDGDALDLFIVGAGPAGFACSLEAKARGLRFRTIDQESLGGTVAKYPRRKLVMTQPVELPLHGTLRRATYAKEELMELWQDVARRHELPIDAGVEFRQLARRPDGTFLATTSRGEVRARLVVLALGRRGTPRKLGVPGEELPKVAYHLIDAQSYRGRHVLVVGGGDSAIEAAVALAEQPQNRVTVSYRQSGFFRLKTQNERRLHEAVAAGRIRLALESVVKAIEPDRVRLEIRRKDAEEEHVLRNDDVFVMAGGVPPFALLEKAGVSFDPKQSPPPPRLVERGPDTLKALLAALLGVAAGWGWFALFRTYYALPESERALHAAHELLRPAGGFGLACGVLATALLAANLLYLARRAPAGAWLPGSLRAWMTSHVATGTIAFLLVLFHGGMHARPTTGGYAFGFLAALAVTGAIGRYFYSFVPRAANGKEAALEDLDRELVAQSAEWDRHGRSFGEHARQEIQRLVESAAWGASLAGRIAGLFRDQRAFRAMLRRLQERGRAEGLSPDQLRSLSALAARAHRTALMAARYEGLRGLLGSWRTFHRWLAFLMLVLVAVHIATAALYAGLF